MMTPAEIATARAYGHDADCADSAMEIVAGEAHDAGRDVTGHFDDMFSTTRTLWDVAAERLVLGEIECVCASSYRQDDDGNWLAS